MRGIHRHGIERKMKSCGGVIREGNKGYIQIDRRRKEKMDYVKKNKMYSQAWYGEKNGK